MHYDGYRATAFKKICSTDRASAGVLCFVLRLVISAVTGKYGVYPAVFFYEQSIGCIFCGLAGIDAIPEQAEQYGITQTTIAMYRNKIETLMERQAQQL